MVTKRMQLGGCLLILITVLTLFSYSRGIAIYYRETAFFVADGTYEFYHGGGYAEYPGVFLTTQPADIPTRALCKDDYAAFT